MDYSFNFNYFNGRNVEVSKYLRHLKVLIASFNLLNLSGFASYVRTRMCNKKIIIWRSSGRQPPSINQSKFNSVSIKQSQISFKKQRNYISTFLQSSGNKYMFEEIWRKEIQRGSLGIQVEYKKGWWFLPFFSM